MGNASFQSYFWQVIFALIGGSVIVVGLILELLAEKKWFKNLRSMRFWDSVKTRGELIVIIGIIAEMGDGVWTAFEIRNAQTTAAQNNPLLQPVSVVSGILQIDIGTNNYDPHKPISYEHTFINFYSTNSVFPDIVYSLAAKRGEWFNHVENPMIFPQKIVAYGIFLRFEEETLLAFEPSDTDELAQSKITVSNAISKIKAGDAYIDFVPKGTKVKKGKAELFINGYRLDFQIGSNSVNKDMSEWNPDRPGLFLNFTNPALVSP